MNPTEKREPPTKDALARFLEHPEVKAWYDGVVTELKESTREQYILHLMRCIGKEDPASFLRRAQEKPRDVTIEIKNKLGELYKHSMNAAHFTKYALRSFLGQVRQLYPIYASSDLPSTASRH